MTYDAVRLTDRAIIRAYLNRDRRLTTYALGDLDDAFWPDSEFYGACRDGQIVSLLLIYRGLEPSVLSAFGEPEGVRAIFEAFPPPGEVYYLFPLEMDGLLSEHYQRYEVKREWRMVLDPAAFAVPPSEGVARIQPEQADLLSGLYRHAAAPGEQIAAFNPWQIAHGTFYGVWQDGELVATAGTHVWSSTEGVTAIGNVFTRPDYRGRGYATQCTAAVAADALSAGLDTIVLNVREDNDPAIHVYEKLGFRRYCLFWEGPGLRRSAS